MFQRETNIFEIPGCENYSYYWKNNLAPVNVAKNGGKTLKFRRFKNKMKIQEAKVLRKSTWLFVWTSSKIRTLKPIC